MRNMMSNGTMSSMMMWGMGFGYLLLLLLAILGIAALVKYLFSRPKP